MRLTLLVGWHSVETILIMSADRDGLYPIVLDRWVGMSFGILLPSSAAAFFYFVLQRPVDTREL